MMSSTNLRQKAAQTRTRQPLRRAAGVAAILLAVVIAVWGLGGLDKPAAITPTGNTGTLLGDIAPDFTVPTLGGGVFTLGQQRGKPVIVFFMAYWCGTCIPEGQALAQLQQEYGDRLNIIAIDVDPSSTPEALAQFKRAAGDGAFTWAFDAGQQVVQSYEVRSLDTTLVLDENGVVIYRDEFPSPYNTLKDALTEAGI